MKNVQKYRVIKHFVYKIWNCTVMRKIKRNTSWEKEKNSKIKLFFKFLNSFFLFHFRESTGSISIQTPLFFANCIFYRLYTPVVKNSKGMEKQWIIFSLHIHYFLVRNIQTISLQILKSIYQGFLLIKLFYLSYLSKWSENLFIQKELSKHFNLLGDRFTQKKKPNYPQ